MFSFSVPVTSKEENDQTLKVLSNLGYSTHSNMSSYLGYIYIFKGSKECATVKQASMFVMPLDQLVTVILLQQTGMSRRDILEFIKE